MNRDILPFLGTRALLVPMPAVPAVMPQDWFLCHQKWEQRNAHLLSVATCGFFLLRLGKSFSRFPAFPCGVRKRYVERIIPISACEWEKPEVTSNLGHADGLNETGKCGITG